MRPDLISPFRSRSALCTARSFDTAPSRGPESVPTTSRTIPEFGAYDHPCVDVRHHTQHAQHHQIPPPASSVASNRSNLAERARFQDGANACKSVSERTWQVRLSLASKLSSTVDPQLRLGPVLMHPGFCPWSLLPTDSGRTGIDCCCGADRVDARNCWSAILFRPFCKCLRPSVLSPLRGSHIRVSRYQASMSCRFRIPSVLCISGMP